MDDLISRRDAILETWREPRYTDPLNVLTEIRDRLRNLPSAEPESCDMCDFCDGLESGDKLFQISDWDGGIGFDYIYIKYCPMCGRRL